MAKLSDLMLHHRAVRDVRGDHLLPLSELKYRFPDIHAREVTKYEGREALRDERVLPLGCGWTDVLFFSPVHPALLLDAARQTGRAVLPVRFWRLRADGLDPEKTCIHFARPWPDGQYLRPVPEDRVPFTARTLLEASAPTPATLTRLRQLPAGAPLIL